VPRRYLGARREGATDSRVQLGAHGGEPYGLQPVVPVAGAVRGRKALGRGAHGGEGAAGGGVLSLMVRLLRGRG